MNNLETIAELKTIAASPLVHALGWALLHFLWQGAALSALCAVALFLLRNASANARYMVASLTLLAMFAAPVATTASLWSSAAVRTREARAAANATPFAQRAALADGSESDDALRENLTPEANPAESAYANSLRSQSATHAGVMLPWLVLLWVACVLLLWLRFFGGWLRTLTLRRDVRPARESLRVTFERIALRLRVSPAVRLCESLLVEVPTVVGWWRPVVLVPIGAILNLDPRQLEVLLAHELAHIRRRDYLVNLLQVAAESTLFYHPAVWWVSSRIRIEREHACDDIALEACDGDALRYARALATLEDLRRQSRATLAVAANGGQLMQRIRRIADTRTRPHTTSRAAAPLVACLFAVLTCVAIVAGARAATFTNNPTAKDRATPVAETSDAPRREVAVTFVAFPGNNIYDEGRLLRKTRKLMNSLAVHDIRAVGFVNEASLRKPAGEAGAGEPDEARVTLLREWLSAGHELGNETFRHTNLYRSSVADFQADVLRGEEIMTRLTREEGKRLRYFSYPYLNTGANLEAKTAVEKFLRERGYEIHPVTIDNMDWLFSRAYIEALRREDEAAMTRIRAEYVPYMERMFEFSEAYAREVTGRDIPQVLMLTAGALTADCFDDLAAMMKRRGYSFVTMEHAMRDDAYKLPDTYTGERGDSWIGRWAVTKGMKYKHTEEINLPPFMRQYLAEFKKELANKNGEGK